MAVPFSLGFSLSFAVPLSPSADSLSSLPLSRSLSSSLSSFYLSWRQARAYFLSPSVFVSCPSLGEYIILCFGVSISLCIGQVLFFVLGVSCILCLGCTVFHLDVVIVFALGKCYIWEFVHVLYIRRCSACICMWSSAWDCMCSNTMTNACNSAT